MRSRLGVHKIQQDAPSEIAIVGGRARDNDLVVAK